MFKYFFIILITFSLSHCSPKDHASMWNIDKEVIGKNISKLNFDYDTSFNEFKRNIIKYGKISDFPKLD